MINDSSCTPTPQLASIHALLGPRAKASLRTEAVDGHETLASQVEALKAETKASKEAVLSLRGTVAALTQTVTVLQQELFEAKTALMDAQKPAISKRDIEEAVREALSPSLNYFYGQVNNSITQALNSVPITMAHNIGPMLQNVRLDRNDFRALMSKNDVMAVQSNTLLNLQNQLSQIQLSLRKQSSAEVALLSQMQVYISKMLANERERPKIEKALLDGLARLDEKMETFSLQKTASAAYRAGSSANHNPRRAAAEPAAGSCQSAQPMAIDNDTTCVNAGSSTSGRTYSGPSNDEIIESQAIQPTDNDEPFKTGMELLGEAVSLLQQSGSPLTPRKKGEASGGSRPLRRSARKRSNEEEQQGKNQRRRILLDNEHSPAT